MIESWEVPGFLNPFAPVAGFTFTVDDTAIYELNASGGFDVCLTLLRSDGDSIQYIGSNDDYPDLGSNSRVVELLMAGDYIALISPYGASTEGEVTFSWSADDADISILRSGRSEVIFTPYETESVIYQLNLQQDTEYSISVESEELDPIVTLLLPDGESLYDDDGGDGTNSLMTFSVTGAQAGDCFLIVEKYSSAEGTFTILLETGSR